MNDFWAQHPLLRILCEQPAIWSVPLAITLMILVSKATAAQVPPDIRMKMLVLAAPEQLGLNRNIFRSIRPAVGTELIFTGDDPRETENKQFPSVDLGLSPVKMLFTSSPRVRPRAPCARSRRHLCDKFLRAIRRRLAPRRHRHLQGLVSHSAVRQVHRSARRQRRLALRPTVKRGQQPFVALLAIDLRHTHERKTDRRGKLPHLGQRSDDRPSIVRRPTRIVAAKAIPSRTTSSGRDATPVSTAVTISKRDPPGGADNVARAAASGSTAAQRRSAASTKR